MQHQATRDCAQQHANFTAQDVKFKRVRSYSPQGEHVWAKLLSSEQAKSETSAVVS